MAEAKPWWFFPFEPAAWLGDSGVQSLSWADQAKWFRLLLAMDSSPRRGVLLHDSGAPMDDEAIAELLRVEIADWKQTRAKLLTRGVASTDEETGALYNRKMLRDTEKQASTLQDKRRAGALGASKRWGKPVSTDGRAIADPKQAMGNNNKNTIPVPPDPIDPLPPQTTADDPPNRPTPTTSAPPIDPLNSVNFRVGLLLLLETKLAEPVAKSIASSTPLGRIAAVVIAAQGQKSPGGWTRAALEDGYVVPELDETERARVLKMIADIPRLPIPEGKRGGPRAGETSEDYFARVQKEAAERKAKAGSSARSGSGAKFQAISKAVKRQKADGNGAAV